MSYEFLLSSDDVVVEGDVIICDPQALFCPKAFDALENAIIAYADDEQYSEYHLAVEYLGQKFFLSKTAFGDGTYPVVDMESGTNLESFVVESGSYCVVPADLASLIASEGRDDLDILLARGSAIRFTLGSKRAVSVSGDGDAFLGNYKISTEGDDDSSTREVGRPGWLDAFDHDLETSESDANLGFDPNGERTD
jgi:hypothetical protein